MRAMNDVCLLSAASDPTADLLALRAAMARLGGRCSRTCATVAELGAVALDRALPGGGLRLQAIHEVGGRGAAGFTAALAGRVARVRPGLVVWCQHRRRRRDEGMLHGPGLMAFGLDPDRILLVDGANDAQVLWAMEEALRSTAVTAVVGEVERLDLFRSRRLHLAAETGGGVGLLLRPAATLLEPSAAVTRWRVRPAPSLSRWPGELGPLTWSAELWRAKGAVPRRFEVVFDEPTLRFDLVADLAHGSFSAAAAAHG